MRKDMMLGVNSKNNRCCKLLCLVPFERIVSSEVEATDFVHDATNWCGNDEIKRTLKLIKMKQTAPKMVLIMLIVIGKTIGWQLSTLLNRLKTTQN